MITGKAYLDPGDRMSGRIDPPEQVTVLTQWACTATNGQGKRVSGPRNVLVRRPDGGLQVIPFSRRLRKAPEGIRLAAVVRAHADPALNAHFPPVGPCGICGVPGLPQRHRVVDAIAGRLAAGENPGGVAEDYGVTPEAIEAVRAWMERWPGAWR
jgi:hypothetical protein